MNKEKIFRVGGIELHVSNRVESDDRGPSIHAFGQVRGKSGSNPTF